MNLRPDVVTAELRLRLILPGSQGVPVPASIRYDRRDPFAVHVGFHTGSDGTTVNWTFARQLLADGLSHPAGSGDVRVWPSRQPGGHSVWISLSSPSGSALFEAPLGGLVEFLARSYQAVPTGAESQYVDVDAELALLLWSDQPD